MSASPTACGKSGPESCPAPATNPCPGQDTGRVPCYKVRAKEEQQPGSPKNLYLVGFMACGKSQLGKQLALQLHRPLQDTDTGIEESLGMLIPEIFALRGEAGFREIESRFLRQLPVNGSIVVTGGGLPCFGDNLEYMHQTGAVVYIQVEAGILSSRLQERQNREQRPLLQNVALAETLDFVQTKLKERLAFYQQADFCFRPQEEDFSVLYQWAEELFSHTKQTKKK